LQSCPEVIDISFKVTRMKFILQLSKIKLLSDGSEVIVVAIVSK